ncbi:MAG: ATP-binding protein [Alphaproteobacteria bacterium]|nr:ATP-binding protein [Alphaproteobacteria bacterium]
MLIRFFVKNYKSIKEQIVLDMTRSDGGVPSVVGNNINYLEQKIDGKNVPICRIVAIFGPNASGKSNILKALLTMRQLVINGETSNFYNPFVFSAETEKEPTELRIMFSKNGVIYDYGIVFDKKGIEHEYLKKQENGQDLCVFDTKNIKTIPLNAWTLHICRRQTMLVCIGQNIKDDFKQDIENVINFFKQDIVIADDINLLPIFDENIGYNMKVVTDILMDMDIGFCNIDVKHEDRERLLSTEFLDVKYVNDKKKDLEDKHTNCLISFDRYYDGKSVINHYDAYDVNMVYKRDDGSDKKMNLMRDESTGTKNLFRFVLFLMDVLKKGKIIAFDEIDRTIHTELIHYIFSMIKAANLNTKNAQLICSSHNPCVMEYLDNSEILIVNKNDSLSTEAIRLSEYKLSDVKYHMEKVIGYLRGRYKGVPNVSGVPEEMEL